MTTGYQFLWVQWSGYPLQSKRQITTSCMPHLEESSTVPGSFLCILEATYSRNIGTEGFQLEWSLEKGTIVGMATMQSALLLGTQDSQNLELQEGQWQREMKYRTHRKFQRAWSQCRTLGLQISLCPLQQGVLHPSINKSCVTKPQQRKNT